MYARVVVYKFRPGTAEAVYAKAEAGLTPIFREQAGFQSYEVIRTGPDSAISVSRWESEAQARKAVEAAAEWVKQNIGESVLSADTYVGAIAFGGGK